MRPYTGIAPETLPPPEAPDFQSRLRGMLQFLDYWATDASFGFQRITVGETPDGSGTPLPVDPGGLLDFLYLPGRTSGQVGYHSDSSAPFFTLNIGRASTDDAGPLTGSIWRFATTDGVALFNVAANGATTINVPYTTYASGNPVALTLQMNDATGISGDNDFFKISTNGSDVMTVGYFGLTQHDMTTNDVAMFIDQVSGSTSDFLRLTDGSGANPRTNVVKLGIDSAGDIYGGNAGTSTLNLYSDNLFDSTTGSVRLTAGPTFEIRSGNSGDTFVPYQFGIGLAGSTPQFTMLGSRLVMTGHTTGPAPITSFIAIDNTFGPATTIGIHILGRSTQSAALMEFWREGSPDVQLGAINSAGAYALISGAAVGSVYTCQNATTGVGAWATVASLVDVARTWTTLQTFRDTTFKVVDDGDSSKTFVFSLGAASANADLTLSWAGTADRTVTIPTGSGNYTLAGLQNVQTFTRAQTIAPNQIETSLDITEGWDGASVGGTPIVRAASADGSIQLALASIHDAGSLTFAALHTAPEIDLWPTVVGSGIARSRIVTSAATTVTFTLPAVSGTALVVAGSASRTNSTSTSAATLVAVNPNGGQYQINVVANNGSTAGDRVLGVTLNWTDARGARTAPLVAGYALNDTSTAKAPQSVVYTVRTAAGTTVSLTFTLSGTTGTYDLTAGATKVA